MNVKVSSLMFIIFFLIKIIDFVKIILLTVNFFVYIKFGYKVSFVNIMTVALRAVVKMLMLL